MKKRTPGFLVLSAAILMLSFSSCKPKDSDVQASVQKELAAGSATSTLSVSVNDGVATLSGVCPDEACKSQAEATAKGVKGVKSVVNNITVNAPAVTAPVEVNTDTQLNTDVMAAVKDHPGVTATVNDGVVTLTGEIKRKDLATLMQKVNALHPKKVDNQLTVK